MNKKEFLQERLKGVEYIQPEKCAQCKNCCVHGSCSVLPIDIEPFTVENVMKEIEIGKYSIDMEVICGGVILAGLHVRECGGNTIDIYRPHTKCTLLRENGCLLDAESRPVFALTFVPGNPCKRMISDREYFKMWSAERDIMEHVVKNCSSGKSPLQLMLEHFDTVALEIYKMLLNKTKSRDYFDVYMASVALEENLYDKIIRIANSEGTTDNIVERLVNLEGDLQTNIEDPFGQKLAQGLLHPNAYKMLRNFPLFASIEEKVEACLEYNKMYI